ncbi:MAG: trigger factor [Cytophagaceae bacterium]|jgi:trigger factor|nr:trigger factor [Cytophagaceae bacterium]
MEILLEKKDSTNARLKVNLKEADYQPKIKEKLKEYGKKANMKGFRPGKVPASLISKMYGKSILVDEINNLLYESVNKYIKDNSLDIVGDPMPVSDEGKNIDWDNQKDFEFSYELGLVPEFAVEISDKVSVTQYSIKADEKVVEETITNLRNQYGEMQDAEAVSEGDYVKGDLKEKDSDFKADTLVPMNRVSAKEAPKFLGKKVGDTIEFVINEAFEDPAYIRYVTGLDEEKSAEKVGKTFQFTITNIRHAHQAELNQEFFDKIFGKDQVSTLEEFKTKLAETVSENYVRESTNKLETDIIDRLTGATDIDLPKDFLKKWLKATNEKVTDEVLEKEFDLYVKELKWTLIKNKIAKSDDVKIEYEEVMDKTRQMFMAQFGMSTVAEEMKETMDKVADNYLKDQNGKNYMRMLESVFNDKVLNLIRTKITIQTKEVSVEEFKNLA